MPTLSLYSAGSNARGQLATGNLDDAHHFKPCIFSGTAPGDLPSGTVAVEDISCGANHTLALLRREDGTSELWGSGDGSRGQLGPTYTAVVGQSSAEAGDATAVFRPLDLNLHSLKSCDGISLDGYTVRLIAAGWETSYTVLSCPGRDDVLLSMGGDDFGNLGVGGVPARNSQRGSWPPIHVVPLREAVPAERTKAAMSVLALSAGPHHTIAHIRMTSPDGSTGAYAVGWGSARHGQLGPHCNTAGRPLPSTPKPLLVPVPAPEQVIHFALGNQHTACLRSSGALFALGSNRKGQTSGLDTLRDVERVGCTWNGTYALLRSGSLLATGSNTHSQLGRGTAGQERQGRLGPVRFPFEPRSGDISRVACGSEHVLCIVERAEEVSRQEVWGWGWNEHGNLGTGGTEDVDTPTKIWPRGENDRGRVVNVWAGCGTSWVLVQR